jgi:hypothetical protein
MRGRWNQLPPIMRVLAYAVTATLVLVMAVGIGAVAALMVSRNVAPSAEDKARSDESSRRGEQTDLARLEQTKTESSPQQYPDAKRGQAAHRDSRSHYVDEVGDIQARSVNTFSDSHERFLRYDALTSGDIEKLQVDQATLKGLTEQADALDAPQKYEKQRDVFGSAIDGLHRAARLSYVLAVDPISATQADFEQYDHLVKGAAAGLQRSNEILGKDYKTIEEVQGVSASQ